MTNIVRRKFLRGPPRVVKYNRSAPQKKRNQAFKTCANWWTKNYTYDLLNAWSSFSYDFETAYNAFLRINIHRIFNDLPIDPTPPLEV